MVSCQHTITRPEVADTAYDLQMWDTTANALVERNDESGWSSRLVAWKGRTKHHTVEE